MVRFFCPYCWKEIAEHDATCPFCGGDIPAADAVPFPQKVRAALHHPEPQTRVRAAWILGELRELSAKQDLMALVEKCEDSFVAEAAAEALGKIGGQEAITVLQKASKRGTVRVRLAARKALEEIASFPELPGNEASRERVHAKNR